MHGTLSPQEWYDLNRFTLKLNNAKSPVLSLYLPSYEISEGVTILNEKEYVRLEEVRNSIADMLGKMKNNSGSVCFFGWSDNGESVIEHTTISKEVPPFYVILRKPYLKPLKDILEIGYKVVVIIMDHKRAKIEVFAGSELVEEMNVRSYLKGRHSKGGWSQKRFKQNRELQIRYFFNKVRQHLESLGDDIDLVLLGGNGIAKKKFVDIMDEEFARKTHNVEGISFDTPKREIARVVISLLDNVRKVDELKLLANLAEPAKKGLVIADNRAIEKRLAEGAVERLFLAADYYATSPEENSAIRRMIRMAKRKGAMIEFITDATARKRLHKFGNVVALLRYR